MASLVETVQPLIEGWERGDFAPVPRLLDPNLVLTGFTPSGEDRVQGTQAIAGYMRDFFAEWRDYRIEADRVTQIDDRHVFIEGRQHGVGRSSGMDIHADVFIIVAVDDGRATGIHWHAYRDGAFTAAGLDDPAASRGQTPAGGAGV